MPAASASQQSDAKSKYIESFWGEGVFYQGEIAFVPIGQRGLSADGHPQKTLICSFDSPPTVRQSTSSMGNRSTRRGKSSGATLAA
ncbi:hypothetical protein XH83_37300 (plasmid) [Bradyrhizobium sp. CCBAU 53351]|uniref:Uncharacterized protein n=2 Tax=Bradyrhizobium TaxID=374 RepID=A0AAE5X983_9BRAD|nr:hypothetical protein X265_38710 [Bradyrhizobium guangdongense]QAU51049.1 hypothetical protein XH91_37910 [Bradyrhizobium guangzhouense]QOZ49365.1 hypothetical protein XH89_38350 [Bradyrhizobium sp. CCBAU 53340]QOZ57168.1 hypothetical protein XH90_38790 [Bradyrhizobium sp. CCBAU 53338]QOZ81124.1 hypothetical protein XH83_37300 [Bradyrhizobium sp. CCBAU 53351]